MVMAMAILMPMAMVSMPMVLVLLATLVPQPPLLPGLPRDLASVVLMLNLVMDFMVMEFLLVFLTTELFTVSTSFTQLVTPSNMWLAASVVLMLKLMLMLTMAMDIPGPMDMLTVDMDMDMATDMAMDMDTMVNQTKLLHHQFEI